MHAYTGWCIHALVDGCTFALLMHECVHVLALADSDSLVHGCAYSSIRESVRAQERVLSLLVYLLVCDIFFVLLCLVRLVLPCPVLSSSVPSFPILSCLVF